MNTTPLSVADRIEALLARVEGVRRGSDCPRPIKFDRRGEQHAQSVAARDAKSVDTAIPVTATSASVAASRPSTVIATGGVDGAKLPTDNAFEVIAETHVLRDPHTQLRNREPVTGTSSRLSARGGR
jgi:hypothetical protein